jgi:hypothetical protein
LFRRLGTLAAITLALGAILTAPAATAAPTSAPCSWTVQKVVPPAGYEAQDTRVTGTDSHGNYSGFVYVGDSSKVVLWTNGQPRVVDELADFVYPQVTDENSAGTVLLSGWQQSTSRAGAFIYAGAHTGVGTLTYLPAPAGYRTDYAVALNERGDVLATGRSDKDGHPVTIVWSTLAAGPIVIDTPLGQGVDLDDDGTVLLYDGNDNPGHLWRNGQIIPLDGPRYPVLISSIRGGKVIGTEVDTWPESQAVEWHTPTDARPIQDGGTAQAINAHGLIAGSRTNLSGPAAVWQDTTLLAELPLPAGVTDDDTFVVGDDGTIFGAASGFGALRWSCTAIGG